MFRRNSRCAACLSGVVAVLTLATAAFVAADDKEGKTERPATAAAKKEGKNAVAKEKPAKAAAQAQAIDDLALANALANYGRKTKSPSALVSAARIMATTRTAKWEAKRETKANEKAGDKQERPESAANNSPKALLEEARKLAPDDDAISAQCKEVENLMAESPRGAFPYPKQANDVVDGYGTVYYTIDFRGESVASVSASGDGYTDLDLFVFDENGNLVASDESYSDQCSCQWIPAWTGPFTVYVKNLGAAYNRYSIWTN